MTEVERSDYNREMALEFLELMKQETKMSIILILQSYRSLNLRQISKVMGISEPSCHAHIVDLLKQDLIELDPDMAGKRGKYYKIHGSLDSMLSAGEAEFENFQKEGGLDYYATMAVALRSLALMSQRFGIYAATYIEEQAEKLSKNYDQKEKSGEKLRGIISGQLSFAATSSQEEVDEIMDAFKAFTTKVEEINKRNRDIKPDDVFDTVMISGLIIPLLRLDPREQ